MPCYTVKQIGVALHAANRELLKKALAELKITIDYESGGILYCRHRGKRIEIRKDKVMVDQGNESIVSEISKAYGRQVIEDQARKQGFQVRYQNKEKTRGQLIKGF